MARGDISTINLSGGNQPKRVAASATRFYAGEPINTLPSYSSGVASVNTVVVLTDGKPVIGTDAFQGIAAKDAEVDSAGTVIAHTTSVTVPIAQVTRLRGKAKTTANADTESEAIGLLGDLVLFDLTSAVYTIDETAAADTSGLIVVWYNAVKATLDVHVDPRVVRADVS